MSSDNQVMFYFRMHLLNSRFSLDEIRLSLKGGDIGSYLVIFAKLIL